MGPGSLSSKPTTERAPRGGIDFTNLFTIFSRQTEQTRQGAAPHAIAQAAAVSGWGKPSLRAATSDRAGDQNGAIESCDDEDEDGFAV